MLAQAALVVVPTESYRHLVAETYQLDLERIRVLPNGTNMPEREPNDTPTQTSASKVRLLSVGRVSKEKNLTLLIDAMNVLVNEERIDIELEIVGDGPDRDQVTRYAMDHGLASRVHMTGRLDGVDLIDAYDRADIFVMTSVSDSFGMVLIEAMARGIPTIAPDIVGVRDVVIDEMTGLLVEHSANAITEAVLRILREPGLRDRLLNGAREQRDQYEWPRIARACGALYEEVLQSAVLRVPICT